MEALGNNLPPQGILSATMMEDLVGEARLFIETTNATTIAATGGLALGLFFVITSIALYYFYYSGNSGRSGGDWEFNDESHERQNFHSFVDILDLLEKSWLPYGVKEPECQKRLMCEAHLSNSSEINEVVSESLRELLSPVTEDYLDTLDEEKKLTMNDLLSAAQDGLDLDDCNHYVNDCPRLSLDSLPKNK